MSKEERFIYICDGYDYDDYDEIIYDTKEDYNYVSLGTVVKILNKQDHENKVLAKALELACNNSFFEDTCDYCIYCKEVGCPKYCETEQGFEVKQAMNYFKQQAEKEMKDE